MITIGKNAEGGGGVCLGILVGVVLSLFVWAAAAAALFFVLWHFGRIG